MNWLIFNVTVFIYFFDAEISSWEVCESCKIWKLDNAIPLGFK